MTAGTATSVDAVPVEAARRRGRMSALLGGAFFGTLGPFSKLFYQAGGGAFALICFRVVGTAVVLGCAVALRRRMSLRGAPLLFALALGVPQLGQNYALLEGFSRAPAGLVILMFYIYPLVVCLGERFIFHDKLDAPRLVALTLGIVGIALTVGRPSSAPILGVALGLGAGLCTGTYILASRHLFTQVEVGPIELIAVMYVLPASLLAVVAVARRTAMPSGSGLAWALVIIAISSVLAMLSFYSGIQHAGAGVASLLATVEPFVAVVLAYVLVGEALSLRQLAGGALILGAVLSVTVLRLRAPPPVA